MSECWKIEGAYQHPDVRIGWYPYKTIVPTTIHSKPDNNGTLLKVLPAGSGVAWQSVRNPTGSLRPPRRLPISRYKQQYAWCYSRAGTVTGWICVADIEVETRPFLPPLEGPGKFDFEVGYEGLAGTPKPKKPSGCGRPSLVRPIKKVAAKDMYLRYSPRGTAFHYLHRNDVVKILISGGPHGFAFVEVISATPGSSVSKGTRGWTQHLYLGQV